MTYLHRRALIHEMIALLTLPLAFGRRTLFRALASEAVQTHPSPDEPSPSTRVERPGIAAPQRSVMRRG
jgi:hypothetical protein